MNLNEYKNILASLIEAIKTRLEPILVNHVFKSISFILASELQE